MTKLPDKSRTEQLGFSFNSNSHDPVVEKIEMPVFAYRDLVTFFLPYIKEVMRESQGPDLHYLAELLGNLRGEHVTLLKKDAFFYDLALANGTLPQAGKKFYFQSIGDSVMGVFGFYPEVTNHRHELRDREFFVKLGSRAYGYAASNSPPGDSTRDVLMALGEHFKFYLGVVNRVRTNVDGDNYIKQYIERERKRLEERLS